MTILFSSITGGGAGGLPRLAPDLAYPSTLVISAGYVRIIFNPMGALTTALSLTGKHAIDRLELVNLTLELITIKLTIDGVVIWNSTFSVPGSTLVLFGYGGGNTGALSGSSSTMQCESSLLLEVQTLTDTAVNLQYIARPII